MIDVITITLSTFTLCAESEINKRCFPIAIGKSGYETPIGHFTVTQIVKCPIFVNFKTGVKINGCIPSNPLGNYFIGFKRKGTLVWGVHGTNQPSSIGKRISHGCVRTKNEDIETIFPFVDFNTKVIIKR